MIFSIFTRRIGLAGTLGQYLEPRILTVRPIGSRLMDLSLAERLDHDHQTSAATSKPPQAGIFRGTRTKATSGNSRWA
jgi:hypothetical protein